VETSGRKSYAEFSQTVHERSRGKRVPLSGTLELTWRCNLSCRHCCCNLPVDDGVASSAELTTTEYLRLFDQLAESECFWLLLTGGEPLIRRDFRELYIEAKKRGFLITLFTNGTCLTPETADLLAEWPPFQVEITLYGHSREVYEAVTQAPGSFARCLRGIDLLRERGIPLGLKTVVMRENKAEIGQIKAFTEELGLSFRFDGMITPRLDRGRQPLAVRLTPRELLDLDLADEDRVKEWERLYDQYCRPSDAVDAGDLYQCGAGITGFSVDPYGGLRVCSLSRCDGYDLRSGDFASGWQRLKVFRAKKSTRSTRCDACHIKVMCGMCPANAELEEGDPETPVDFLCETAHLRASRLTMPVREHGDCRYCSIL
jgi:radical SAM protein with 4Fe4S-binding SPASM domain